MKPKDNYSEKTTEFELQQYLPFTVLKHTIDGFASFHDMQLLQQYLPFTVLKLIKDKIFLFRRHSVATVPTVYGIET